MERKRLARSIAVVGVLIIVATASVGCFGPLVLVDAIATGRAWEDTNCDGVEDPDEAPIEGACIWTSKDATAPPPSREDCASEPFRTNSEGVGGWTFYAGAWCSDVYIFAQAPDGYSATTDTVVNGCVGEFGFAPEGTCPQRSIVTPESLAIQQRILLLIKGLVGGAVVAAFVFFYRKYRRGAVAREDASPAE